MKRLPDNSSDSIWPALRAAAMEPEVDAALRDLYRRLDAEIAGHRPVCGASGRCCHFDSYGHRLYVTALEAAWLVRQIGEEAAMGVGEPQLLPQIDGCPFQIKHLCGVHEWRPLGCRIFFCDPSSTAWQGPVYEKYLDELRTLHERLNLPYRYAEWRALLAEALDQSGATP